MANQIKIGETIMGIGDLVRIHSKIKEGDKERVVIFDGMVIKIRGRDVNKTFTVRKIGVGKIGIEMIWPASSPSLVKVEVRQKAKKRPRRAKLYYLRRKQKK